MLDKKDYTLIIDKSGSMLTADQAGGKSRWAAVQESAFALAAKCESLDPDGISLYLFSGRFKRYDNVTASRVTQVFRENEPSGSTNLAGVLQDACDSYFRRKASHKSRPGGEVVLVITDGEADDPKGVMKAVIDASRRMDRDEELSIALIQVGGDPSATRFLKALDDDLSKAGAKFDICDTLSVQDMEDMTLTEVLMNAVSD